MADDRQPADLPADKEMTHEGSGHGPGPSVRLDPAKRQNYHLNYRRERVYHDVPQGFALDDEGAPVPIGDCGSRIAELAPTQRVSVANPVPKSGASAGEVLVEHGAEYPALDPEVGAQIPPFAGLSPAGGPEHAQEPAAPAQEG